MSLVNSSSSSSRGSNSGSMKVRVGVRVRPLTSKERNRGGEQVLHVSPVASSMELSGRTFTFDSVFDASSSQAELYETVSPSLLRAFLDGYNATIMAYGQTGSGKTFTMGSEAHTELHLTASTGLIPRFMKDLFANIDDSCKLETTFLEVYGEDVHDLLQVSTATSTPLPLREDSSGGIVVTGLTSRPVQTAAQALDVLHEGTLNRTTAATLMNLTSSRSHAVFTVTLTRSATTTTDNNGTVASHTNNTVVATTACTSSRFTFVDLAGSERMKKTGAQGERAREGIEINKGLLALGNVINALAGSEGDDEERTSSSCKTSTNKKTVHVPYRQSKLTRLLQDALGGNSQTLFLACVSPADTNASETLSTLHYANRARNIQNAVTRNVDPAALELSKWQAYASILQAELIAHKFGNGGAENDGQNVSDELMQRKDVNEYLDRLHALSSSSQRSTVAMRIPSPPPPQLTAASELPVDSNQSVLENFDPALLDEVNPDEDMAILDQLLDLQQHDQDYGKEQKQDDEKLKLVEGELAEQEQLLLQLRESLKVYHNMKAKYENLMAEVQQLELEKAQLAKQLEKASADPTLGCSRAIKKEMDKVEHNLIRARNETRRHRQLYKKAELEAQKCRVLEQKICDLKQGRATLMKKQKEAASRHRELTESKTREILALKRKDRSTERQMTKLQSDIQIHKRNLDKRQVYCNKLLAQKKQTEAHLLKLLAMRQRELRERTSRRGGGGGKSKPAAKLQRDVFAVQNEEVDSIHFLLDKAVGETVTYAELKQQYEERVGEYSEAMRSMVAAVKDLEVVSVGQTDKEQREVLEHTIQELEVKVELSGSALEKIQARIARLESQDGDAVKQLIKDKSAPVLRTVLVRTLDKLADSELHCQQLGKSVELKASVVSSLEMEVESLGENVTALKNELVQRHSVVNGAVDPVMAIDKLKSESVELSNKLQETEQENELMRLFTDDLVKGQQDLDRKLAETKEQLAVAQVAISQSDGVHPPVDALEKLQAIWDDLGVSALSREDARCQIQNCLPDTVTRKLSEAQSMKANTETEIAHLEKHLRSMCFSLAIEPMDMTRTAEVTLLDHHQDLNKRHLRLMPIFASAVQRRDAIAAQVSDLCFAIGISKDSLQADLLALLEDASRTVDPDATNSNERSQLSEEFLSRCDASMSELRMRKSKILADNSNLQKQTLSLVSEMGVEESELLPLVLHSVKRRSAVIPSWWNKEIAEMVSRAVAIDGGVVRSTGPFSQHLAVFHESLSSVAQARRCLSDKLRVIVERAQNTLLKTVDREFEANEAYSSFHEALFRLPCLSKERIQACLAEIDALISGVDAMSQSEIEALTVVWEALNISMTKRGKFWGAIDESVREMESQPDGPFDDVVRLSKVDGEEWVLVAVKDGTRNYRELETRLFRLEKIHQEVEQLRTRQDAKSRIISLDTEVRILSSKLNEFEDKQCVKQRLTTKKNTSSTLLKEERFRKQMQTKFTAKLEQLVSLLKVWKTNEKSAFDQNLLSEDVRMLLKNSDRNEFMHLRTVEYKPATATKRGADSISKREGSDSPPTKRLTHSSRSTRTRLPAEHSTGDRVSSRVSSSTVFRKTSKREASDSQQSPNKRARTARPPRQALPPTHRERSTGNTKTIQPIAYAQPPRPSSRNHSSPPKKRLTLDPFGTVLEQAFSPTRRDKENV